MIKLRGNNQYLPWRVHYAQTAKIAVGEAKEHPSSNVNVVIVDENRQSTCFRAIVAEEKEGDEHGVQKNRNPQPSRARLK